MSAKMDIGTLIVHLRADVAHYMRGMTAVQRRMGSITRYMKRMALRGSIAVTAMAATSVKAYSSFDDAMTKSLALFTDMNEDMRKQMTETALEMSRKSTTSATDLAKGYFYLASAGLDAATSIKALRIVNTFAEAGSFDLATATELVADAQSALGLESSNVAEHLKNMTKVTDILVGANTLANATTQEFAEALQISGPIMRQYGISIEGGVSALAAYAKQGKKGAVGGELFSRMIRLSVKAMLSHRDEWDKLGISLVDANDKMRSFSDIGRDLTKALSGMGVMTRAATLDMLGFQARSQQAIFPLLGMGDTVEEFEKKLSQMNGTAKELAEKNLKSFSSQMKILWGNIKSIGIAIGERLAPSLVKIGKWFSSNEKVIRNWAVYFADRLVFVGEVVFGLLQELQRDFPSGIKTLMNSMVALIEAAGRSMVEVAIRSGKGIWLGIQLGITGGASRDIWDQAERQYEKTIGRIQRKNFWTSKTSTGTEILGTYRRFYKTDEITAGVSAIVRDIQKKKVMEDVFSGMGENIKGYYTDALEEISESSPHMKKVVARALKALKIKDLARETSEPVVNMLTEGADAADNMVSNLDKVIEDIKEIGRLTKAGLFQVGTELINYTALRGRWQGGIPQPVGINSIMEEGEGMGLGGGLREVGNFDTQLNSLIEQGHISNQLLSGILRKETGIF